MKDMEEGWEIMGNGPIFFLANFQAVQLVQM